MTKQTRSLLKTYFETGKKPTQAQFEDLIDSLIHVDDDLKGLVFRLANREQARSGLNHEVLMTPLRTKEAIGQLVRLANISPLRQEVESAIQRVVGAAPASLNTLQEIASALNNDANLASTLTSKINAKANASHAHDGRYYTESEIDNFFQGTNGGKKLVHWNHISFKPNKFSPSSHKHTFSQITGKITETQMGTKVVSNAKIADGAVSLDKLDTDLMVQRYYVNKSAMRTEGFSIQFGGINASAQLNVLRVGYRADYVRTRDENHPLAAYLIDLAGEDGQFCSLRLNFFVRAGSAFTQLSVVSSSKGTYGRSAGTFNASSMSISGSNTETKALGSLPRENVSYNLYGNHYIHDFRSHYDRRINVNITRLFRDKGLKMVDWRTQLYHRAGNSYTAYGTQHKAILNLDKVG